MTRSAGEAQLNRMAEKLEFPRKAKCAECGLIVEQQEGAWVSRTKFVCDGCRGNSNA